MRTLQSIPDRSRCCAIVRRAVDRPALGSFWWRPSCWHLVCLTGLLLLGCRADNSTVLLERDLRLQEDKIYHLQACLEDAQMAREATIRENEALKRELDGASRRDFPGLGPDSRGPDVELPPSNLPPGGDQLDLTPPTIDLPEPSEAPSVEMGPAEGEEAIVVESPPTQLVINSRLTGGMDRDGHGGDEGILVVFEPRDAAGHLVRWPGSVSVVLMDPALEGEGARIARWNFSADEVPTHYLSTVFGRGLQFELPWPSEPPQHDELVLFVRFTTQEGNKLTSDAKIKIRSPNSVDAPIDRETRRSSDGDPNGSAERREPRSRLKARRSTDGSPRAARNPNAAEAAQLPAGDDRAELRPSSDQETPLEAKRTNRPAWKPYR